MRVRLSDKELNYALYGFCLGDGQYKGGRILKKHTNKQKFYVEWTAKFCRSAGLEFTDWYDVEEKTNLGTFDYSGIRIKVKDRRHFEKFGRLYKDGKRVLSSYVLDRINVLGLLFWYLDDGSLCVHRKKDGNKVSRFMYLNTHSYTEVENEKISKMFYDRFEITTSINIDRSPFKPGKRYYRQYFNASNFRKFYDLVRGHLHLIPGQFDFKFNMQYTPNRLKESSFLSANYNGLRSHECGTPAML